MPAPFRLVVYVQPRARRTAVVGAHLDGIKVQVAAPPVDGAANESVVALLARTLGIPRRGIRILQGAGTRKKVIELAADTVACREKLAALQRSR